jgi:3-phosphoglycerate kinase
MCQAELAECKTIIWNGPMGVFEMEKFAKVLTLLAVLVQKYKKVQTSEVHFYFQGTNDVAKTLAECTAKVHSLHLLF